MLVQELGRQQIVRSKLGCLSQVVHFADKTNLDGFEYWISIFNYQAPCGWSPIPPIEDIIQVCGPSWQGQPLVLVQSPATVTCVLAYARSCILSFGVPRSR